MSDLVEETLTKTAFIAKPSLEDYYETDAAARELALQFNLAK
jgi:pantothenate kinase-related protein Tda10